MFELFFNRDDYYFTVNKKKIHIHNTKLFFKETTHPVLKRKSCGDVVLLDIFFYKLLNKVPKIYINSEWEKDKFYIIGSYDINFMDGRMNYPYKGFYPLIKHKYYNTTINIPSNYNIYLDIYYGNEWPEYGYSSAGGLYKKSRKIIDYSSF